VNEFPFFPPLLLDYISPNHSQRIVSDWQTPFSPPLSAYLLIYELQFQHGGMSASSGIAIEALGGEVK